MKTDTHARHSGSRFQIRETRQGRGVTGGEGAFVPGMKKELGNPALGGLEEG